MPERLKLEAEGATDEMIRRGLVAAWAVLDAAGASAFDAYAATYTREAATFYQVGMRMKYEPFTPSESKLAARWDDAGIVAAEAIYGDEYSAPLDFDLLPRKDVGMTLEEARRLMAADRKARAVHKRGLEASELNHDGSNAVVRNLRSSSSAQGVGPAIAAAPGATSKSHKRGLSQDQPVLSSA
jgi:hypothetical protein